MTKLRNRSLIILILTALSAMLALPACGLKGDLYLPDGKQSSEGK